MGTTCATHWLCSDEVYKTIEMFKDNYKVIKTICDTIYYTYREKDVIPSVTKLLRKYAIALI